MTAVALFASLDCAHGSAMHGLDSMRHRRHEGPIGERWQVPIRLERRGKSPASRPIAMHAHRLRQSRTRPAVNTVDIKAHSLNLQPESTPSSWAPRSAVVLEVVSFAGAARSARQAASVGYGACMLTVPCCATQTVLNARNIGQNCMRRHLRFFCSIRLRILMSGLISPKL